MFKNATFYILAQDALPLDAMFGLPEFVPCGSTQERSTGFVPPRGEAHGAIAEAYDGGYLLRHMSETKTVPADALKRRVDEKVAQIERERGRKPGRNERKELKAEALLDLLPHAFPKQKATWVWVDAREKRVVVDTSSQSAADGIVTDLGLGVSLLCTELSPRVAMARWLLASEAPAGFTIDRECELQSEGEDKAAVRYARHPLDIAEIQQHINAGKRPVRLALTWQDRVSFELDAATRLRKIKLLDVKTDASDKDGFDADLAIFASEMRQTVAAVVRSLNGLMKDSQ
jgi:recombination associated protein RdgC